MLVAGGSGGRQAGLIRAVTTVILRSRALARRLEGWPRAPAFVAHPSRLAEGGEHLRMTVWDQFPVCNSPNRSQVLPENRMNCICSTGT